MSNTKFITDILNINETDAESITSIQQSDGSIIIKVRLKPVEDITCPYCNGPVIKNGFVSRKLTHSTLVNRKCTLIFQRRRYICQSCECSFSEKNPFINTSESLTIETKINVLKDLKFVTNTYSAVADRFNLSTTKVMRIFDQCVDIKRKPLPEVLSIDEHYFPESNYDSLYICIFMDFNTGTIIDVLPDRKKDFVSSYLSHIRNTTLTEHNHSELDNVKYVSIDMYDNYKELAEIYFPNAKICADSFHVIKHLTQAFKNVRLRCRRKTEDEDIKYLLSKFKFIFTHGFYLDTKAKYNKRFKRYLNYRDIMNILFDRFPDLQLAYELKEDYIHFNTTTSYRDVKEKLSDQISHFADSNIHEYDDFYNLLLHWFDEIVNSFIIVNGRRINNSYIESRNNQIERLIYNAYGFKNFKRTRNRILYCLNKNNTYKI